MSHGLGRFAHRRGGGLNRLGRRFDFRLGDFFRLNLARSYVPAQPPADLVGHVVVNRTGVRLLLGDAELGQQIQDLIRLDLEFASQLVDPSLLHTVLK